jgi:hypothetical protein
LSPSNDAIDGGARRPYDARMEAPPMIELTEQRWQALEDSETTSLRPVSPRTGETFVLLRLEEYERNY